MNNDQFNRAAMNGATSKNPNKKWRIWDVFAYLLCLVVAFGIWAYVTTSEAEEYEYQFTGVAVNLEGVAALADGSNLSPISVENQEITVTVRGSRREISKYTSEDIYAYVDLSAITTANRHSLEVHVDLPGNIQLVSANPSKIAVFVDEMVEKQVPIKVDMIYSAEANVTILDKTISINDEECDEITVSGPKSVVDYISHALVTKDVGKITTGVHFTSSFVLIDKAGEQVTNRYVKTNTNDVTVSVPVEIRKTVRVVAVFETASDDPYEYTVVWDRETVDIVGSPEIVSGYEQIEIEIENISSVVDGSAVLPGYVRIYVGEEQIYTLGYTVAKNPKAQ